MPGTYEMVLRKDGREIGRSWPLGGAPGQLKEARGLEFALGDHEGAPTSWFELELLNMVPRETDQSDSISVFNQLFSFAGGDRDSFEHVFTEDEWLRIEVTLLKSFIQPDDELLVLPISPHFQSMIQDKSIS